MMSKKYIQCFARRSSIAVVVFAAFATFVAAPAQAQDSGGGSAAPVYMFRVPLGSNTGAGVPTGGDTGGDTSEPSASGDQNYTNGNLQVSAGLLDFGLVAIGDTSAPQTVTFTNVGGTTLGITPPELDWDGDGAFLMLGNTCGNSLDAGASCSVLITFSPTNANQSYYGYIYYSSDKWDDSSGNGGYVNLSGSTDADIKITPVMANLWDVPIGTTQSAVFTVTNVTAGVVDLGPLDEWSGQIPEMPVSTTCEETLAAGASCAVTAVYTPISQDDGGWGYIWNGFAFDNYSSIEMDVEAFPKPEPVVPHISFDYVTLPDATVGLPYSFDFSQHVAEPSNPDFSPSEVTFSAVSGVPDGLILASNGVMSGTLQGHTDTSVQIVIEATYNGVTDTSDNYWQPTSSAYLELSGELPDGDKGKAYSYDISDMVYAPDIPDFDPSKLIFSNANNLPDGLTLSSSGVLSGILQSSDPNTFITFDVTYDGVTTSSTEDVWQPVMHNYLDAFVMKAGAFSTCAAQVSDGGHLLCWGADTNGQLGDGRVVPSTSGVNVAVQADVSTPGGFSDFSVGYAGACALSGVNLYCWGDNSYGENGNGTMGGNNTVPTLVGYNGNPSFNEVTRGNSTTCAVGGDASAWCWGNNNHYQLGNGTTANSSVPVRVSDTGQVWKSLAMSDNTVCGIALPTSLATDYKIYCWGVNLVYYGSSAYDMKTPTLSATVGIPVKIVAGSSHFCELDSMGSVYCWGQNGSNQLGNTSVAYSLTPMQVTLPVITKISANGNTTCALSSAGQVYCWGSNSSGQFGDGTTIRTGNTPSSPINLPPDDPVTDVAVGNAHACFQFASGIVECAGSTYYGQLGDGYIPPGSSNSYLLEPYYPVTIGN